MPSRLEVVVGLLDEIIIVVAVIVSALWLLVAAGVISGSDPGSGPRRSWAPGRGR